MRPVRRGPAPATFENYQDALPDLVQRMGSYCSYCERCVRQGIAVEHVQAQDLYPDLKTAWSNFLLACTNCNSTKSNKDVKPETVFLPDRDNTLCAFSYAADGIVRPAPDLTPGQHKMALEAIALTGLATPKGSRATDGVEIPLDRIKQRKEVWQEALDAKHDLQEPGNVEGVRKWVIKQATARGFFSIWMTVFADDPQMRLALIHAFAGAAESGCFDLQTAALVSPAPNPDQLPGGGKI
ncbi:HNH endonuclease [Massilia sp. W12]|uniref:HNH endonuclease n=1 Tax=Massilia sp. W12 TaxID=3126507 RepID=UPI0030CB4D4E